MDASVPPTLSNFSESLTNLGFKLNQLRYSDEYNGALDGFSYQYIRNNAINLMDIKEKSYSEFYVYLLKTKYTFIAQDNDLLKSIETQQFEQILKSEEELRVFHVHFPEEEREKKLPFKWAQSLKEGHWQYDLTENEFLALSDETITPLEEYLTYGI